MIELKSTADIAAMREAGRVVAQALAAVRATAAAGTSLSELDAVATRVIRDAGATPAFLGYHPGFAPTPFPGAICASVNAVIVHGIPDATVLRRGDLLSIDCGAVLGGWVGDAAFSMIVGHRPGGVEGDPDPLDAPDGSDVDADPADPAYGADRELIRDTRDALAAGIAAARPGARLGDIGAAIGAVGRGRGRGIPQGWGGHGIGRSMHEAPSVGNEGRAGRGMKLKPGLVIAIEPMFHAGGDEHVILEDGWSVATADGTRAAHEEHTVAITDDGPEILTAL